MAIAEPPSLLAETIRRFRPEAIIIVYHDDGAGAGRRFAKQPCDVGNPAGR
ncbi:MAG: hypothetical protein WDN49_16345 [Acetobacteraceae bacterium]